MIPQGDTNSIRIVSLFELPVCYLKTFTLNIVRKKVKWTHELSFYAKTKLRVSKSHAQKYEVFMSGKKYGVKTGKSSTKIVLFQPICIGLTSDYRFTAGRISVKSLGFHRKWQKQIVAVSLDCYKVWQILTINVWSVFIIPECPSSFGKVSVSKKFYHKLLDILSS